MTTSRVYVGIVTYNSSIPLLACLRALLTQTRAIDDIIVLDNNSPVPIDKTIKRFPAVRFIKNKSNAGFGGGHNAILSRLKLRDNDFYLALNPDAVLHPDFIKHAVGSAQKHKADWLTGKLYKNIKRKIIYSVGHALLRDGYAFNIGFGLRDQGQYDRGREVFGAPGAAAMYRGSFVRALVQKGHFFDPGLFMYYEDVDIDWRGQLAGKKCWYEPTAIAGHPGGKMSKSLVAGALINRFLSIYKNAFLVDLCWYNIPRIILHTTLRLFVTPSVGVKIFTGMPAIFLLAIFSRTKAKVSRSILSEWFYWSEKEETGQPRTYPARIRAFIGTYGKI